MMIANLTNKEIILDTGESVDITSFVKYKYGLEPGKKISDEMLDDIKYETGLENILKYCTKYQKTHKEVEEKLKEQGYNSEIRERIVDKLKEEKYVDEYQIALDYIEMKDYGSERIRYELKRKGVKREVLEAAFEDSKVTDGDKIEKLLKKINRKDKKKQIAYLMARGFLFEDILEKTGGECDEY